MDSAQAAVTLEGVAVVRGGRTLIEGAEATLHGGRLTALIGRNGAGKSSLLRVLAGVDPPARGRVTVCGHDVARMTAQERARSIALVTTERVRVPSLRCRDLVALGRAPHTGWSGRLGEEDSRAVARALALTGMEAYADRTLDTMSDGERQRVMIARALAQDTPVVLLDEPTSFLDMPSRYELALLLRRVAAREGKCIVYSTHELDLALRMSDDVALVEGGTPGSLTVMGAAAMAASGAVERLFALAGLSYDAASGRVESCGR